jgi:hypothetical protein
MTAMAWCQEFGVQIHEGCDHLMAADVDSCSCAECGVVCHGKFPGCATVWAAGPVAVTLRHPPPQLGAMPALPRVASGNGKAAAASYPLPSSSAPSYAADSDIVAVLQMLRLEIQALNVKVDGLQIRADAADQAARDATQAAVELPLQIGQALSTALHQQQQGITADLEGLRDQVLDDLEELGTALMTPTTATLEAAIVAHLDARLEWLVNELSRRFVVLGNEVFRINKHLAIAAERTTTVHTRP